MKKITLFLVSVVLTLGIKAQNTWTLDKAHAKLGFSVTHLLVSDVEGYFKNFDVKVTASNEKFTDVVIELMADINSINTDNEARDKHLRSEDFFDAAKYPALTFKSTGFKLVSGKKYQLTGNLTMRGITKPITLDVTFNGTVVHPYSKKTVAGFKITGTINRLDYSVGTGTSKAVISDEVEIRANIEIIKD